MSFHPLNPGIDQSLLGVGANPDLIDTTKFIEKDYVERAHYLGKEGGSNNNNATRIILTIIISAIIFVTIVSIFDVFRNAINNYYAKKALLDPKSGNTQQEIDSTLIANHEGLISSIIFAVLCVIISIIVIYFAWSFLNK